MVGGASVAARGRGRDVARFAEPCLANLSRATGAPVFCLMDTATTTF